MKSLKSLILLCLTGLLVNALSAADGRDQISQAARLLSEKPNYSWTTSTREADGGGGKLGPIDGKIEKGGLTWLSFVVGGLPVEVYMQDGKGTAKAFEGWQTFDDVAKTGSTPAAVIRYLRSYQNPALESAALAGKVKAFQELEGALAGELPEDTVKEMLLFGARRREGQEPQTTDVKGSIRFWLQAGALARYEIKVQGKVTAGDRESVINRTVKVEIKDVGATKLEVPPEAKQKMS